MVLRIVIADQHEILRSGLRAQLDASGRAAVVGEARCVSGGLREALEKQPDLLVTEIAHPQLDGIELIRQVKSHVPRIKVLVLSEREDRRSVLDAVGAGASGYVSKAASFEDFVAAIGIVAAGGRHVGSFIARQLIDELLSPAAGESSSQVDRLSLREREVLRLVADGRTTVEIARRLKISPHTVQTHRKHLMEKLGVHHTVALTRFALRHGLADG